MTQELRERVARAMAATHGYEIAMLRLALRLIAEHPVEKSGEWEVAAREMQKVARMTLGASDGAGDCAAAIRALKEGK